MSRRWQTLRESLWYFSGDALALPAGLLLHIYLARELPLASYGVYALAAAFAGWVEWSLSGLFSRATLVTLGGGEGNGSAGALLQRHAVIGAGAGLVLWIISHAAGTIGHHPDFGSMLRWFAFGIPLSAIALFFKSLLIARKRPRVRLAAMGSRWSLRLGLTWLLVNGGHGAIGACMAVPLAWLAEIALAWAVTRVSLVWRSGPLPVGFWKLAGVMVASSIAMRLFDKMDLFMIGALLEDAAHSARYAVAQHCSLIPGFFAMAWSAVMLRQMEAARGDDIALRALVTELFRIVLWLVPFAAAAAITSRDWLPWVFGADYAAAVVPFRILMMAACVSALGSAASVTLVSRRRLRPILWATLPLPLLAAGLQGLLVPNYGTIGAAAVTLGCAVLSTLPLVWMAGSHLPLGSWRRIISLPALTSALLLGLDALWGTDLKPSLIPWSVTLFFVIATVGFFLGNLAEPRPVSES